MYPVNLMIVHKNGRLSWVPFDWHEQAAMVLRHLLASDQIAWGFIAFVTK
jgi:hypothetical protein